MSDTPAQPTEEQRLALLLRGVQRMADALGGVDERLQGLAGKVDENRVRSRAEVAHVGERVDRLQADVARSLEVVTALGKAVQAALEAQPTGLAAGPSGEAGTQTSALAVEHLTDAVRALRDDLATAWTQLRQQTASAVERVAGEQAERTLRLVESVSEARQQLLDAVDALPAGAGDGAPGDGAALAALRETLDGRHVVLTESLAAMQDRTMRAVSALRNELVERLDELPPPTAPADDSELRQTVAEVRDELRGLHGEVVASAGQLRTDVGARQAQLRDEVLGALQERLASFELPAPHLEPLLDRLSVIESRLQEQQSLEPVLARLEELEARLDLTPLAERLAAIEWRMAEALDPIQQRLDGVEGRLGEAIDPIREQVSTPGADLPDDLLGRLAVIEASLATLRRDLSLELESVAADNRRGIDRVVGEVRGVDERIGGMADDLRGVRQLRDGLQALLDGVDATRQIASRAATSQQMAEVTRELGSVLAEIESARSQVLRAEQTSEPHRHGNVVDVEVDQLGRRIEHLAEVIEARMADEPSSTDQERELATQVVERLRNLGTGARQLGNGVLEDLRRRRR